jgi:thiol-disulfide isomerase/thioredoxin
LNYLLRIVLWAALALLAAACAPAATSTNPLPDAESAVQAENAAVSAAKPRFIDSYATWCTTCRANAPIVDDLERQYNDRVEFVQFDFDDPALDAERHKYDITDRSQYVLVDADDQIVYRWYGYLSAADVQQVMDEFLAGA